MLTGYYNRFDPSKEYEEHLFRAGYVLQSAELNEVQSSLAYKIKSIGDALFKDGDVVRDCRVVVNQQTGIVQCESGAIYLRGAVRGIPPGSLNIPTVGVITIGVYLLSSAVTEVDDPDLRDPASLTRNYQEPGAGRRKLSAEWGFSGDGQDGDFFPVYTVENGVLLAKEAPPNLDSFNQALARYDRDSAGGSYVVNGLAVQRLADLPDGRQVYTVAEGRARVNGYGVEQATSRRLVYDASPDLREVNSEPHASTTVGAQRINVDRTPINNIVEVTITAEKTVTMTHGGFSGAQDPLPDTSVLEILEVKQGATTYAATNDYKLTAGKVDWSPSGAEPATGSSYTVKYRYLTVAEPSNIDATGFTVTGAVQGTLILATYNQKLPRIDRLAMTADGQFVWLKGVSADWNPQAPAVPNDMLLLATIYQAWGSASNLTNDGVRVVPMQDLAALNSRIDYVLGLVAQQRLESSASLIEAGQKKGVFVDPFFDDTLRDAGVAQTGACVGGELTLPVSVDKVAFISNDVAAPVTLNFGLGDALLQLARTGTMKVNAYLAFNPIPAVVTLTPSVDRWVEYSTVWASAVTQVFTTWSSAGILTSVSVSSSVQTLSASVRPLEFLRAIDVQFSLAGFGPGETLTQVKFDGVVVTPSAI